MSERITPREEVELALGEIEEHNVNTIANLARDVARSKGWEDETRTVGDRISLWHSELSEALEEHREGYAPAFVYQEGADKEKGVYLTLSGSAHGTIKPNAKPQGIPIEIADAIIRMLHFCAQYDIDIMRAIQWKLRYNLSREERHGDKKI